MTDSPAISIKALSKKFRIHTTWFQSHDITALNSVSFDVMPGQVLGIVGPNGSGKSTLLRILATSLLPSSGNAWVDGHPIRQIQQVKTKIGVVPSESTGFLGRLTACQNLNFYASLQKIRPHLIKARINEVLQMTGLAERKHQPLWTYSTGLKQRLNIARALVHNPPILLFDEPMKGVDPWTAESIRSLICGELIQKQKKTLLIATNQMEDVDKLCDEVAYLKQGHLIWKGAPEMQLQNQEIYSCT